LIGTNVPGVPAGGVISAHPSLREVGWLPERNILL
jgi:hypothetical protein